MRTVWWLSSLMVIAIFGGVALSVVGDAEPTTKLAEACGDEDTAKEIRAIMLRGLDAALQDRFMGLFETWMKDPSGQPNRARQGIEKGIAAYLHGRKAVQDWELPACRS